MQQTHLGMDSPPINPPDCVAPCRVDPEGKCVDPLETSQSTSQKGRVAPTMRHSPTSGGKASSTAAAIVEKRYTPDTTPSGVASDVSIGFIVGPCNRGAQKTSQTMRLKCILSRLHTCNVSVEATRIPEMLRLCIDPNQWLGKSLSLAFPEHPGQYARGPGVVFPPTFRQRTRSRFRFQNQEVDTQVLRPKKVS